MRWGPGAEGTGAWWDPVLCWQGASGAWLCSYCVAAVSLGVDTLCGAWAAPGVWGGVWGPPGTV